MPALSVGRVSLLSGRPALAHIPGNRHGRIRLGLGGGGISFRSFPLFKTNAEPRTRRAGTPSPPDTKNIQFFDDMAVTDFQELWTRLCENDVEYNELKHMCKYNELGGKDMKYKLRAKLIKEVRERLGKPPWTRESYGMNFKYPNKMSDAELQAFFEEREIVMPDDYEEGIGFAFAIMVQDGVIDQSKVPIPSTYDTRNTDDLKKICRERNLPQSGNKAELMTRLIQHDQETERQWRAVVARSAAELEMRSASIDIPPVPPNRELAAKLDDAVHTAAALGSMTLPELRSTAYARGLPVYGTVEALQDRIMEVLRREAVEAHAGKERLLRYAEAAVQTLDESEVLEALAMRGIGRKTLGGPEEVVRLINTLVDEWIHNALQPAPKGVDSLGDDDAMMMMGGNGSGGEYDEGEEGENGGEENFEAPSDVLADGEDPTLDIFLLCSGATQEQRETSLAAARGIIPNLQSDVLWGTLNPATEREPPFVHDAMLRGAGSGGGAAAIDPPSEVVDIFCLEPMVHGVLMRLDCPLVPADTILVVTATPCEGEVSGAASVVVKECRPADAVALQGLSPGTGYEFSARLRNSAGDGPEGEPYLAATPQRQGIAVQVLYEAPLLGDGDDGSEERRYVMLGWEELHASTAEELDIKLHVSGAPEGRTLRDLAGAGSVVLPLGPPPPPTSNITLEAACVGSWVSPEVRQLVASRPAFVEAARKLGYFAVDLLALSAADLQSPKACETQVVEWLHHQGLDPLITRVAVRVEVGGHAVASGIGRGIDEVLEGAAHLSRMQGDLGVVLEAVHPAAVFFSCGVVAGTAGVVALPPTEISYHDFEEDVFATEMELEQFYAVTDGKDAEKIAALVEMEKETRRLPVGALGKLALPTQRALHSTPPASLPSGVSENIRIAAAKLFSDLGLTDFAEFSGWVVPEDPLKEAGLGLAAELMRRANEAAVSNNIAEETAVAQQESSEAPPPKTFAEMQKLFEAEQSALKASSFSSSPLSPSVSQSDRDVAVDVQDYALAANEDEPEAAMANLPVLREAGEGVDHASTQYGTFAGIVLDDRTRADILNANPLLPMDPIPLGPPPVEVPTALPDLNSFEANSLCSAVPGRRITFSHLDVTLSGAGDRLGVLAQQSAAAGLSLSTLPRQLVSNAAVRAGLPPLATLPQGPPADYCADEEEEEAKQQQQQQMMLSEGGGTTGYGDSSSALFSSSTSTAGGLGGASSSSFPPSLDDIGHSISMWEWNRTQSGADDAEEEENDDSYDAIRNAAEAEAAAKEAASAADALEGTATFPDIGENEELAAAYSPFYDDFMVTSENSIVDLRRDFPGLHPTRQRVWVLCGGEGPQRDESLKAAVHAAASLQNEQDLLVETFFLDPYDAGLSEGERRRTLLKRRLDLLKIGATDDNLLEDIPEFHPTRIRHPSPPNPEDLSWRGVWRLGSTHVVKTNVPNMKEGCEELLAAGTTAFLNRHADDVIHRENTLLMAVKTELELAGVSSGGPAPWGGYLSPADAPTDLPEYSFLKEWANAAQDQCVVVLLALPGHPIAQGPLQRLLEARQVPFTGPSSVGAELCADRPELLRTLGNEPPFHSLSLPELAAKCDSAASADDFHARLFGGWEGKILSIRPAHECGGLGVLHAATGHDLRLYYAAVREWADVIPADLISGAQDDEDVQMPVPPPTQFIIEPASRSVWLTLPIHATVEEEEAAAGQDLASRLTWPPKDPKDRWLEVKACLLGSAGSMRTLGLSATVLQTIRSDDHEEDDVVGSFELTAIPTTILSPEKALEAKLRLQQIADSSGLSGAAQITALVDTTKSDVCEVIVREVNPHPDLTPGSLLMRQAASANSPLSPTEVLRELLKVGMSRERAMEVGELSWLSGGGLYDLGADLGQTTGSSTSNGGGGRDGAGSPYWGEDIEIEEEFLGLTEEDIQEEIRRQKEEERRRKEALKKKESIDS